MNAIIETTPAVVVRPIPPTVSVEKKVSEPDDIHKCARPGCTWVFTVGTGRVPDVEALYSVCRQQAEVNKILPLTKKEVVSNELCTKCAKLATFPTFRTAATLALMKRWTVDNKRCEEAERKRQGYKQKHLDEKAAKAAARKAREEAERAARAAADPKPEVPKNFGDQKPKKIDVLPTPRKKHKKGQDQSNRNKGSQHH